MAAALLRHIPDRGSGTGCRIGQLFAFVFSGFEIPYVLGQPYPAMLGVLVQRKFVSADLSERPEAMAAAMLTAIIAEVGIRIAASLRKRFERSWQDGD